MSKIQSYRVITLALLALIALSTDTLAYGQTYSVLYNFGGMTGDPLFPWGTLTQGEDGALYGISQDGGGPVQQGTFFKLLAPGKVKVLYNFCSQSKCSDGAIPTSQTLRGDGHFIGVTSSGGASGQGVIFDITQTGALTKLYDFTGGADGAVANTIILGPDGNFYGTTIYGGNPSGCGTVFRFIPAGASGTFSVLHRFVAQPTDGCKPTSFVLGPDGNFYGVTIGGGSRQDGAVFKITTTGAITLLHSFDGADGFSGSSLVLGNDGDLYGTTLGGGSSNATIFKIATDGTFTLLHSLSGTDGSYLTAGLVQASDGNFYGAAGTGGTGTNANCASTGGCGTLFQITPAGAFTVFHNFDFTDGYYAESTPLQHTSGILYGGTFGGGLYDGPGGTCGSLNCGLLYSWSNSLQPFAALVPYEARIGFPIEILGQGFTASTTVSFNGTPATTVHVTNGTRLIAYVPVGATTGSVTVTTSSGTLISKQPFIVAP